MTLADMVSQWRSQQQPAQRMPTPQPTQQAPAPMYIAPTNHPFGMLAGLAMRYGFGRSPAPGIISGFGGGTFDIDGTQVTPQRAHMTQRGGFF